MIQNLFLCNKIKRFNTHVWVNDVVKNKFRNELLVGYRYVCMQIGAAVGRQKKTFRIIILGFSTAGILVKFLCYLTRSY